jgi:hypothetical protein
MQQHQQQLTLTRALVGALTVALTGLIAAPTSAMPLATQGGAPRLQAASACKALFGASASRARNARHRAARLDWIEEDEAGVTVAHTHPGWEEPTQLRVQGVRLVGVQGQSAVFELNAVQGALLGCKPGRFHLRADDSIGRRSRIIAVLASGVLVEWGGALRFISAPGQRSPRFVMGWRLPGEVQGGATASPSPRVYGLGHRYSGTIGMLRGVGGLRRR